jgi:acyl dehydratase
MTQHGRTFEEMLTRIGSELGVSSWLQVDQPLIDGFGRATKDMDWLHVDPKRARAEGPYGGTIAFGFWTLSMLTHFSHEIGMWPSDVAYGLNYGLERVRWLHPVKVGSRIRMRCTLLDLKDRGNDRFLIRTSNQLEIEGVSRPALVAEWLGMFVRAPRSSAGDP